MGAAIRRTSEIAVLGCGVESTAQQFRAGPHVARPAEEQVENSDKSSPGNA